MAGAQQPYTPDGQPAHREGYTKALYSGRGMPTDSLPPQAFAGFWIRLVAIFIDWLVLIIPSMLVRLLVFGLAGVPLGATFSVDPEVAMQHQGAANIVSLINLAIGIAYYGWFTVNKGGTLGKLALGLRIVGDDCMHVGWGRAIGRYFAYILSFCTAMIGFIMVAAHPKKRGLHDLVCGTFVIKAQYLPSAVVSSD